MNYNASFHLSKPYSLLEINPTQATGILATGKTHARQCVETFCMQIGTGMPLLGELHWHEGTALSIAATPSVVAEA
jgi:hypothetical protein